ncbi:MAG: methanethiol S-methyltransferase [Bacteroidota bacterium]
MKRILCFIYGMMSYLFFFITFLYFMGFLGNLFVPNPIDGPAEQSLGMALLINLGLLALFGLQHSIMARASFKRWLEQFIPAAIERSTYVLASALALATLMWFWQPMGGVVWSVEATWAVGLLYGLFGLGWAILFTATFLIDHFELFGLKQVYFYLIDKDIPAQSFKTPFLYKIVRHPIYLGFLLGMWATPQMSITHLILAAGMTVYILLGTWLEEKDLIGTFGNTYRHYRSKVPMLIPIPGKSYQKKP